VVLPDGAAEENLAKHARRKVPKMIVRCMLSSKDELGLTWSFELSVQGRPGLNDIELSLLLLQWTRQSWALSNSRV
jgi:hypothetical protein